MPLLPGLARYETMLRKLLTIAAVVELLAALYALTLGGFDWRVGPLRISAGAPFRPFVIGAICASLGIWLGDRAGAGRGWDRIRSWSGPLAASVAALTLVVGIWFAAPAAGASDPYGYVSQAYLWAAGNLFVQEPLATIDPVIARAAAPLGYQLNAPDILVPRYSPGLPIIMALASMVGGERSVYYVLPLLGALAVWLTYRLGRRVAGPRTGLLAAIALSSSPIFLYQLFLPMADLAATTWWLAAIVIALSEVRGAALLAGAAAALAIMTRPNLLPLAVPVASLLMLRRPRGFRLALFGLGLMPGCVAIALLNRALYGSVTLSGYGSLDTLFRLEWIGINLRRYPRWLVDLHSAVVLIGLVAPFSRRRAGDGEADHGMVSTSQTLLLLGYCFVVVACYVSYVPFDGWQFLRFWLPAIPVLLVLGSSVVLRLISMLPLASRTACVVALCSLGAGWYVDKAYRLGSFYVSREERRYLTIGNYLSHALPGNAVILAGLHSGSLRLYGGHRTLRWDQLRPHDLDRAVALLEANGYSPFVLVEKEEEMLFRNWFGPSEALGKLDWPPAYEYLGHQNARVYSFEERSRPWNPGALPKPIPED